MTRKNGLPDRRFKVNRTFQAKEHAFWQRYGTLICSIILGLLAGIILGKTLWDINNPPRTLLRPLVRTIEPKVVVNAIETPYCFDVITCIRDIGEEMGESNQHIMQMIRIAKAESGLRPDALGVNRNGSVDRGVFQINSVHKRLSNADAFDFQKNIRFAYKLHQEQGHSFRAWVTYNKGLAK